MLIKVNAGDITKCDIAWKAPRFIRVHHCILFLLTGESDYVSDDENVTLIPEHIYITPINKAYEITQNPSKIMDKLWFHIDGIYTLPNKLVDINTKNDIVMKNIVSTIMSMMCSSKRDYSIIAKQIEIMFSLLPVYKEEDIRIKTITDFIANNYGEKINNKIIAQHLNLDIDYVGRLFRSKMGITLHKYIEKYRIEKACLMLLEDEKIEKVSQKAGYDDSKSFSRMFKKNKGMSVSEYRKCRFLQP